MVLSEPDNGIGSNIYSGSFEISADDAASGFRFYTALGSWGDNGVLPSVGAAADDGDNQAVTVSDSGVYEGACVAGKGKLEHHQAARWHHAHHRRPQLHDRSV